MYKIVIAWHIIAVISWMAGILYLLRLFVYHAAEKEAVVKERFQVMERKLFKIIAIPASTLALFFGAWLLFLNPDLFSMTWMKMKLLFVFGLLGLTHWCGGVIRALKEDNCKITEKTFRYINEVPTLLMIVIVFLVILKKPY